MCISFSLKVCGNNNCLSEYSKSGGNWGPDDDCCTRLQKFLNAINKILGVNHVFILVGVNHTFILELFFSEGNAHQTLCVDMARVSAG